MILVLYNIVREARSRCMLIIIIVLHIEVINRKRSRMMTKQLQSIYRLFSIHDVLNDSRAEIYWQIIFTMKSHRLCLFFHTSLKSDTFTWYSMQPFCKASIVGNLIGLERTSSLPFKLWWVRKRRPRNVMFTSKSPNVKSDGRIRISHRGNNSSVQWMTFSHLEYGFGWCQNTLFIRNSTQLPLMICRQYTYGEIFTCLFTSSNKEITNKKTKMRQKWDQQRLTVIATLAWTIPPDISWSTTAKTSPSFKSVVKFVILLLNGYPKVET